MSGAYAGPWLSGRKAVGGNATGSDRFASPRICPSGSPDGHPRRPGDPPRWERVLLAFRPRPIGFPAATLGPRKRPECLWVAVQKLEKYLNAPVRVRGGRRC